MITSKKELRFYIMADRIMNGLSARRNIRERLGLFTPPILRLLTHCVI